MASPAASAIRCANSRYAALSLALMRISARHSAIRGKGTLNDRTRAIFRERAAESASTAWNELHAHELLLSFDQRRNVLVAEPQENRLHHGLMDRFADDRGAWQR